MRYRERPPCPPLRPLVACYWALDGDAAAAAPPRRVLPDGCADLLLDRRSGAARWIGTMTRAVEVAVQARVDLLGVRFRPGGLHAFLGAPLRPLADRAIDLDDLAARHWRPPLGILFEAADFETACAHLDASLCRALPRLPGSAVPTWLAHLDAHDAPADVAALADRAGLGVRALQRQCLDLLGVSPRQHLRWLRFERARRGLAAGQPLADLAAAAGYADQPHLTREFARFAGLPPGRFR